MEKKNTSKELQRITTMQTENKIKAWEDKEKAKLMNKAERKLAQTEAWQNQKKASIEAESKHFETEVEKRKQMKMEKLKNKEANTQKAVEDKKAMIEAEKQRNNLLVEEKAANYRATNTVPISMCFGLCRD